MFRKAFSWLAEATASNLVGLLILTAIAAAVAVVVGTWNSLDPPWNYTAGYAAGALAAELSIPVIRRYRAGLPPPWGHAGLRGGRFPVTEIRSGST